MQFISNHLARRPFAVAASGALLLLLALATRTEADFDLWGHLRFGLDTLESWHLPAVDPYSFTQDRTWINHEWLSELQMAIAYTVGGVAGLAVLKGTLVATALGLVWWAMRQVDLTSRMIAFAFVVVSTVPLTRTLRPQLWSLVALAVLCVILIENRTRLRRWLPMLFALWVNAHGGWIVGLGILGTWTAVDILRERRLFGEPALIAVSCLLATLCSPYGWGLWGFIYETVQMGRDITEWQPIWNSAPADAVPWIIGMGAALWLLSSDVERRWQAAAVVAILAYSSARVIRVAPLFITCSAIVLAPALAEWRPRRMKIPVAVSRAEPIVAAIIFLVSSIMAVGVASDSLRCLSVSGSQSPDTAAVRALTGARAGRLITYFDWGQYALWHLGPRLLISMDGRRETIYSDDRLSEHAAILNATPEGLSLLREWKPEYVWLPATSRSTREWLLQEGYRLDYDRQRSFVAVRPDLPVLEVVTDAPLNPACFPG